MKNNISSENLFTFKELENKFKTICKQLQLQLVSKFKHIERSK